MSGQRSTAGGILIAVALSAMFLGITVVTSPVVGALVVLPAGILAGALRARGVPQRTPHSLVVPKFESAGVIRASRSSAAINAKGAAPAA